MDKADRIPRLRQAAEDKLARLQKALAGVEWNHAAGVLEKSRKRGHELLQKTCGSGAKTAEFGRTLARCYIEKDNETLDQSRWQLIHTFASVAHRKRQNY